jgi:hypothetical protein
MNPDTSSYELEPAAQQDVNSIFELAGDVFSLLRLTATTEGRRLWSNYGMSVPLKFVLAENSPTQHT